jgi:hypothetical protein
MWQSLVLWGLVVFRSTPSFSAENDFFLLFFFFLLFLFLLLLVLLFLLPPLLVLLELLVVVALPPPPSIIIPQRGLILRCGWTGVLSLDLIAAAGPAVAEEADGGDIGDALLAGLNNPLYMIVVGDMKVVVSVE